MTRRRVSLQIVGLIGWLAASFAAGAIGAAASVNAPAFYAELEQPAWSPPTWVFGPVWSTLFVMMAVAAWLVWRSPGRRKWALGLFVVQLVANALWSWLFFAWRLGAASMLEILILLALIVATIITFGRHSRWAAALLLPYAGWVAFASVLTLVLWRMNPGLL